MLVTVYYFTYILDCIMLCLFWNQTSAGIPKVPKVAPSLDAEG